MIEFKTGDIVRPKIKGNTMTVQVSDPQVWSKHFEGRVINVNKQNGMVLFHHGFKSSSWLRKQFEPVEVKRL